MTRYLVPLIAFLLLAVVLLVGVDRAPEKSVIESVLIGREAPRFVLPSLLDPAQPFDSASLEGRWYVLNVWGTWCPECRTEHQTLVAAAQEGRVPIIGLNWKDDDAKALAWLAQLGNPYEVVAVDSEGRVAIDWGVYGAPETFLVDARGVVVHKHVGPLTPLIWQSEFIGRLPESAAP